MQIVWRKDPTIICTQNLECISTGFGNSDLSGGVGLLVQKVWSINPVSHTYASTSTPMLRAVPATIFMTASTSSVFIS